MTCSTHVQSGDVAAKLLETLMSSCLEGVVITSADGLIEHVNPAFTAITGYAAEEVVGQNPRVLKSDRHDEAFYAALWASLSEKGYWEGEIWNRRKSGEAYPEWLRIQAVAGPEGKVERYISVFNDLTDVKRTKDLLLHEAYHDPLTGLPNRHLFLDRLGVALRRSKETGGPGGPVGVICLDLDRFKTVNDSLGHVAGDIVLTEVGHRLTRLLRQADTLARFDGDSFYMTLTWLRDPEDAAHVAGRILASLSEPVEILDQELILGASLGITIAPSDGNNPADLVLKAEMAMYRAKEAGRNNFSFFTEELGRRVLRGLQLENDLRKALSRGEFVLYYQPRVDVFSGQVTGMEALVRWVTADGQIVSPAEFIPLAEETGLIVPLGRWVMEEACRQAAAWAADGLAGLRLSVNISPRQLEQPGLAGRMKAILDKTGLPASHLEVEVTESVFIKGFEAASLSLGELAGIGVGVALDDFGTGYSSLTYLKKLPITTLKIDKSFVDGLPEDKDDAAIVTSIVSIASNLGLSVVAEGVETLEQLEFLRGLNCCEGFQGYYFARPLPAHEFAAMMAHGGVVIPGRKHS